MHLSRPLTLLLVAALPLAGAGCGSDDNASSAAPSTVASQDTTSSTAGTSSSAVTSTTPASVMMAGETVPTARLLAVAAGLCEALRQAPADVAAAKRTFNGRSHDGLHLIARGLETVDRAASATLLEAKQKVEADFSGSAAGARVAADLRSLADVTGASLARFNVTVDACPSS